MPPLGAGTLPTSPVGPSCVASSSEEPTPGGFFDCVEFSARSSWVGGVRRAHGETPPGALLIGSLVSNLSTDFRIRGETPLRPPPVGNWKKKVSGGFQKNRWGKVA